MQNYIRYRPNFCAKFYQKDFVKNFSGHLNPIFKLKLIKCQHVDKSIQTQVIISELFQSSIRNNLRKNCEFCVLLIQVLKSENILINGNGVCRVAGFEDRVEFNKQPHEVSIISRNSN